MGKTVNLSLRVPEELHLKMKILAAVQNKNMSELFISWLEKQSVTVPDFATKAKPKKRKTGKAGVRKDQNPNADEEIIKKSILKYKASGLSLQKISDQLQADGMPTIRGGKWQKGTVAGLVKKYEAQDPLFFTKS